MKADGKSPHVCVVIPNWNGIDMIGECLDGLRKQTLKHTVMVVEQGSVDGSRELVRDKYPEAKLLEFDDNAGFAGGVNRGIRPAIVQGYEYIVLLNNDAVPATDWLEKLVERAEAEPKVGIVQSKIRHFNDNRLDSTGDFYSVWGWPFPRGRGEDDRGQYDAPEQQVLFAASAGATLYRVKMLRQIGLFDERFFAYYEDIDVSFRAQLADWQVRYEPAAVVRHKVNATSNRMGKKKGDRPSSFARYHTVKNFHYIYTKNMPGGLYWKYLPRFWVSWGMMVLSDAARGLLWANFSANLTALVNLPGILASRFKIQSTRKVTPASIEKMLYPKMPPIQRKRFKWLGLK
jgi:GT2 family glycosyltransferase